jgi:phosphate-selective porin O/P
VSVTQPSETDRHDRATINEEVRMRVARKGLIVLSIAAMVSFPALADPTPQTSPSPAQTTTTTSTTTIPVAAAAALAPAPQAAAPAPAPKPATGPLSIKVSDNVNFRFGLLLQPQADFAQNAQGGYQQNLMLRRTRFIVSGQLAPKAFFFFQTENNRLGGAIGTGSKVISSGFQTVDAVAEYRFSKVFNLQGGLIYLPTSREALKSSGTEFMLDVNTYAYTATGALAGTAGRDTGFMARGYFLADHLEYRAGLFQGIRETGARNTFRKIARLQYEFLDTEPYALPSYPGSYFGTKKILALGAAYDTQHNYHGPTADLYADLPTSFGSALGTVSYMRLDGGKTVPSLGKSNIFVIDGGVFFKGSKIGPWLRYEDRSYAAPNKAKSEKRYWAGVNWYPYLNSFNVKTGYQRLKPEVGKEQNEFTVQLQFFIY